MSVSVDPPAPPPAAAGPLRAIAGVLATDGWARGWRGPGLAALLVLISALPGLCSLPPLDRDEARFAQSTVQMLETGDFVNIRFQAQPRDKKPIGVNWLQALSVQLLSSPEPRAIWAYRVPSLLGAMLAAAACVWGAAPFLGPRRSLLAGAILGASFLLSSEAFVAKTDAALCGAVSLSMAALARVYAASAGLGQAGRRIKAMFWGGQAAAVLLKGPVGPLIAVLALLALWAADRRAKWMAGLGWTWGLLLVLIVVGPWAVAISVSTDAGFWTGALAGDIAPKLAGGHEGHAAPPGAHVLASPLLLFPFTVLLPAAAVHAWRRRSDPGVRFALCWLAPVWLVFELAPTKLPHYPMPLYGGLAWLCAAAVAEILPMWARVGGAALSAAAGLAIAAGSAAVAALYGGPASPPWGLLSAVLAIAAGAAGAFAVRPAWRNAALAAAGGLGVAAHMAITGGLVPSLSPLWVSAQAAALLRRADLDPRNGVTPGPVAVTGYTEPSLVFALGTQTELDAPDEAADALAAGQPVFVEQRRQAAFLAAARERQLRAETVGRVSGFDYSRREPVLLTLWRLKTQAGGSPP